MAVDQLHKDLKAGKFQPIYLLHGEETYLIDEAAEWLEEFVVKEHEKAFDQQILYGNDVDTRFVLEQLMLFPLIAPRRLVIIREAQLMNDIKDLEGYAGRPAPSSILVLCYKGKSLDKRTRLFAAIKENGYILSADALKEKEVVPWIMQTAKALDIRLEPEAADAMIELIGGEISKLYPELKKLKGIHTTSGIVTRTEILDLIGISREYNVFQLQDSIITGDAVKTLKIAMIMADHKDYSVIPLIATLAGYFTRLYTIRSMPTADDNAIMDAVGIKAPFIVKKLKYEASRYPLAILERIIGWLHVYDMKSKGWGYRGGDDRAITIELLGHILHPVHQPEFVD
ncbi:MAG: DNA polymerase III subunit delta [Bacteroidota bacterium]|nr:DNA polymerase III subunit delta [Bacteroidota bacterium]